MTNSYYSILFINFVVSFSLRFVDFFIMADESKKRKSVFEVLERVHKKLILLDVRLNNLGLAQIQLFKVCVSLNGKIDALSVAGAGDDTQVGGKKKLGLTALFTRQTHSYYLTRLHINVVMLTNSPFPNDVDFHDLFVELKGDHEKKVVTAWWHSNRDKIVKLVF